MKFQFKHILMAATAAILSAGAVSCSEDTIKDIENIYDAPNEVKITQADVVNKTEDGSLRTFTVDFKSQEGKNVHMVLLCDKYFIAGTGYSYAAAGQAKNGNFTDGSTIDGKAIVGGTFSLTKAENLYTISTSVLIDETGKYWRVKGTAEMVFEKAKATPVNVFKGTTYDAESGNLTMVFSTGTYTESFDWTTYQTTYTGEGYDFQIVIPSKNGKLSEGTYKPGSGYVAGYTFMNNAYEAWGVPAFLDYAGTLWYTIANNAKVPALVTNGDIIVTREDAHYHIIIEENTDGIYAEFDGDLPALVPSVQEEIVMNNALDVINWAQYNMANAVTIPLVKGEIKQVYDENYTPSLTVVNGIVLNLQVYAVMGEGIVYTGTYEMGAETGLTPGSYMEGMGNVGCYILEYKDGAFVGEPNYLSSGKLEVELTETGKTKLTFTTGSDIYTYTGNFDFVAAKK